MLDDVVGPQGGPPAHALAAALLGAVLVGAGALDVAAAGDGDDHVLLGGDQVLHRHVRVEGGEDLGPTVVAVPVDDLAELLGDDLPLALRGGQDRVVLLDHGLQAVVLLDDPLPLEGGQAAQLHREDRVGLDLVDLQQLHEAGAGLVGVRGAADQRDDSSSASSALR